MDSIPRESAGDDAQERDGNSFVQTVWRCSTRGGAIESFTDRMASDLANMKPARQKAAAELLRGYLARRYGHGIGRLSMGEKAQTVEALVGAYGWNRDETQTVLGELPEDISSASSWWSALAPLLMAYDAMAQ